MVVVFIFVPNLSIKNNNYKDREDVWMINRPYRVGEKKNANTQPLELVKKALKYTTNKEDLVLDPFMGGATTAVACIELERNFIGVEINKKLKKLHDEEIKNAMSPETITFNS